MQKGNCYIVGAGECSELLLYAGAEDMVIAVDGGYEYVKEGRVDLVVGDFDSLGYVPKHDHVLRLVPEKDDTDMMVAIKEGLKAGYQIFHIYGGCGGRFEHTIANVQSLAYLEKQGAQGYLHDEDTVITMLSDGKIEFPASMEGYLSVFSYGKRAEGVCLKGVKYPLEQAVLNDAFPLGVSNEFIGQPASVSVKKGRLLLIYKQSGGGFC